MGTIHRPFNFEVMQTLTLNVENGCISVVLCVYWRQCVQWCTVGVYSDVKTGLTSSVQYKRIPLSSLPTGELGLSSRVTAACRDSWGLGVTSLRQCQWLKILGHVDILVNVRLLKQLHL